MRPSHWKSTLIHALDGEDPVFTDWILQLSGGGTVHSMETARILFCNYDNPHAA